MLGEQRHLFDVDDEVAYFNSASMAPGLRASREAGSAALERRSRPWTFHPDAWFTDSERLRSTVAQVMNVSAEGVALVPSASYGLAVAARNLPLRPDQRVVVLDREFPSSYYTWHRATLLSGASLHAVRPEPGQSWTDAVVAGIDERTAVVQVPNVHWTNGALIDLARVRARSAEVGAAMVIDASQSLGVIPLDVAALRPDVVVAVGYKWMLGAYGLGYLYLDERYRDGEALEQNWIARLGSEDFNGLVDYQDEYQPGVRRFDVGERSNFLLVPVAQAAAEQLLAWGVDQVAETLAALTADIVARVEKLGLTVAYADARGPHIMGVELPAGVGDTILAALQERGVYASMRASLLRVAPHLHVNATDVDRLVDAIASVV
jgi:selenocysteine lyase/cysteine desulfurase